MRWWVIAIGLVGLALGVMIGKRGQPAADVTPVSRRTDAVVLRQVIAQGAIRVDLFLPAPTDHPAPWMVFAHERGWPAGLVSRSSRST